MTSKHKKTLRNIFKTPVLKNIRFSDIETLLLAVGVEIIKGKGSRIAFTKNGFRIDFHKPHPTKEAKPYQVKSVKYFLILIEVTP